MAETYSSDETVSVNKGSKRKGRFKISVLVIFFVVAVLAVSFLLAVFKNRGGTIAPTSSGKTQKLSIKKFASDTEFKSYLASSTEGAGYFGGIPSSRAMNLTPGGSFEGLGAMGAPLTDTSLKATPERVSETNVQVAGIDEPDIVKTDGSTIYFSNTFGGYTPFVTEPRVIEGDVFFPPSPTYQTKVIKAFPPAEVSNLSNITETGEMLLYDGILVVFSGNKFSGYNVSDPRSPLRKWVQELESNTQIVTLRSYGDKLYVIAKTYVSHSTPCPMPLIKGGVKIACTDVYYPPINTSADTTFTVMIVDPNDGSVENKASFLGKEGISVTYMSKNYIYVTYTFYESYLKFFIGFLKDKGTGLVSEELIKNLERVAGYDISETAKMVEFNRLTENYYSGLTDDERKKLENDLQNKSEDYMKDHARDLEKTGIARFDAKNLKTSSSETIAGSPLNQFSVDEYEGNLRIATTTSNSLVGGSESFNDVYILDGNLSVVGKVTDLGLTERIYSARFVEDKGYLVTFRQVDPFYVLDLSDPRNPKKVGELKIPGYSSYLHPINKDRIVGVGQEGSNAKVSLFDVADAANPKEISKYDLSEYWTDVSSNHHAFLLDNEHKVFFMPAGQNGYVFSYDGDVLNLQRAVTGLQARRAIYIDDYLYVLGDAKMVVLNENTWEEIKSFDYQ
jgi:uncharacterized secreted protein with C-terminal beta-propeller domain